MTIAMKPFVKRVLFSALYSGLLFSCVRPTHAQTQWGVAFSEQVQPNQGSDPYQPQPTYYACSGPSGSTNTIPCIAQAEQVSPLTVTALDQEEEHATAKTSGTAAIGYLSATLNTTATAPWTNGNNEQFSASGAGAMTVTWTDIITPTSASSQAQFTASLIITIADGQCQGGGTAQLFATVTGLAARGKKR
jgi:hypothetical protein